MALLLIVLAVATLVSAPAHAAVVPMCSNDGRSVIAPPSVLPWRMLTLDAPAPCPQTDNTRVQSIPDAHERAPSPPPAPAPLRALPLRPGELPALAGKRSTLAVLDAPSTCELIGSLYRPPRA